MTTIVQPQPTSILRNYRRTVDKAPTVEKDQNGSKAPSSTETPSSTAPSKGQQRSTFNTVKPIVFEPNTLVPFSKVKAIDGVEDPIESSSSYSSEQEGTERAPSNGNAKDNGRKSNVNVDGDPHPWQSLEETIEKTTSPTDEEKTNSEEGEVNLSMSDSNDNDGNGATNDKRDEIPLTQPPVDGSLLERLVDAVENHRRATEETRRSSKRKRKGNAKGVQKRKPPPKRQPGVKRVTISERSGLQLPVGRISAFSKIHLGSDSLLSMEAKILLTAQAQYLLKTLTLTSLEKKNESNPKRKTISKEDLKTAIAQNPLFSTLAEGLMIPTSDCGVVNLPLTKRMKKEAALFKKNKGKPTSSTPKTTPKTTTKTTKPKPASKKRKRADVPVAAVVQDDAEEGEEVEEGEIVTENEPPAKKAKRTHRRRSSAK